MDQEARPPPRNGASSSFGVTKEPATDLFARRFRDAGFAVLAFDCRRLGESGGVPRQVVRIKAELGWKPQFGG